MDYVTCEIMQNDIDVRPFLLYNIRKNIFCRV